MKKLLLFLSFLVFISFVGKAQKTDTLFLDTAIHHSPKKATLLSLALPGLGQAYNKKYWKIPLVYAIIGVPLIFGIEEQKNFKEFKEVYIDMQNGESTKFDGIYSQENVLSLVNFHRKNRDLFFVLTGVAYALNVVDATVDAHLFNFDVSDDLSATLKPSFQYSSPQRIMIPSFTLSLKFANNTHRKEF